MKVELSMIIIYESHDLDSAEEFYFHGSGYGD